MMKPIFENSELKMCSIPVPSIDSHKGDSSLTFTDAQINGYGQSQTHPSIQYVQNGWNGHKWWMAATPYPKSLGVFENPCVYYADDTEDGTPPVVFTPISGGVATENYPIVSNPIVKVYATNDTNSDPDLLIDGSTAYLISRDNMFGNHATFMQTSEDGLSWSERPRQDSTKIVASPTIERFSGVPCEMLSPSILKINGVFKYWGLSGSAGIFIKNIDKNNGVNWGYWMAEGDSLDNLSFVGKSSILGKSGIEPWHQDMFVDSSNIYCVVCGYKYYKNRKRTSGVWLGKSTDGGRTFHIYPRALIEEEVYSHYRPTACLTENREFVLYGCFELGAPKTAESYPNGSTDVPVDGRAIYMAHCNFDDMIKVLNNDKIFGY